MKIDSNYTFFPVDCTLSQKKFVSCTPKYEVSSSFILLLHLYKACLVTGLSEAVQENKKKMAKKVIKEKAIEEALWESANKLRGSVEPSEYKHVVLSLIFLKYAYDRFTERRNELVADGKEAFADNVVL